MDSRINTSVSLALQEDSGFAPFAAADFAKGLEWAEKLAFDGVELIINRPDLVDAGRLAKEVEAHHLKVSTLATGQMVGDGLMFCSDRAEVRRAAVDRILKHIDLSVQLGLPNVTVGLVRGNGDSEAEAHLRQRGYIAECLKTCVEYAAKNKVRINLEPINRYETCHLNSVAETASLIEELGAAPVAGILYDTFHSNIEDADMLQTIERFGKNFSHVHFADSNRMVPGNGHINFSAVVSRLKQMDYRGFVSLECLNVPNAEFVIKHAAAVNSFVRI